MKAAPFISLSFVCFVLATSVVHAHGDLHVQIRDITRRIEEKPTAELFLKRGELQREHREFDLALADYDKAAALDPAMDAIYLCRGRALLEAGRPEPALKALDRFLEAKPDHSEGYLTRARARTAVNDYLHAAEDYDRSIQHTKEPRPEHFLERARVLELAGKQDAALAGLDEGMKRLGAIPTLQSAAIDIEVSQQRFDPALKRVGLLIAAAGRKESWQARRAEILAKAGRSEDARQAYRESLASIEALPPRLRAHQAMEDLEKRVQAALAGLPAAPVLPQETSHRN